MLPPPQNGTPTAGSALGYTCAQMPRQVEGPPWRNRSLGRRLSEGRAAEQCRFPESLRVGQAGPVRVWLREQLPTHFWGPATQLVTGSVPRGSPKPPLTSSACRPRHPVSTLPPGLSSVFALPPSHLDPGQDTAG